MLASGEAQSRNPDGTPAARHPAWNPHPNQGWTPDFIPRVAGEAVNEALFDQIVPILGSDAIRCSQDLARKEGIFVGITAGGTLAGALKVAQDGPAGSTILAMLPDTGERYLSTPLFADVSVDMTDEERTMVESSPLFHRSGTA